MMRNIGMTGGIGCGKNTAADIFKELGFFVIDSDEISRKVMQVNGRAYKDVVNHFGRKILNPDKTINRGELGKIVFSDKAAKEKLESIVHPAIFIEEKIMRSNIFAKNSKAVIITHAALMIETESYKNYDALIVITADKDVRIKRIMERDKHISLEYAEKVIANQMNDEDRLEYADFIIDNSGTKAELYSEVKRLYELITQLNYGESH